MEAADDEGIEMFNQRNAVQRAYDEAGDVLAAVPVDDAVDAVGDLLEDVGELAVDVAEAAAATITTTSRVGLRFVTRTVRFVARHPREVIAGLVLVTAAAAAITYFTKRDADAT